MKRWPAKLCLLCIVQATSFLQFDNVRAAAVPASGLWETGNNFYLKKSWDSAAFYYNKIVAAGNADAAVYYNLGNAHFKLGHTGAAVLNYQRALLRKPDYKAAAENLQLAETRIPNRLQPPEDAFFVQWWQAISCPGTSSAWALAAVLLFTLALFFLWRRQQRRASTPLQLVIASAVLWCFCLAMAFVAAGNAINSNKAVVMRPRAVLKTMDGKNIIGVPEGTVVTRKSGSASGIEVVLPDGRSGWLLPHEVAMVD